MPCASLSCRMLSHPHTLRAHSHGQHSAALPQVRHANHAGSEYCTNTRTRALTQPSNYTANAFAIAASYEASSLSYSQDAAMWGRASIACHRFDDCASIGLLPSGTVMERSGVGAEIAAATVCRCAQVMGPFARNMSCMSTPRRSGGHASRAGEGKQAIVM